MCSYIREEEFIRNYRRVRDEFYHFDNVYDERPYFWESSKEKYEHYVRQEDKSTDLAARYIKASINDEVGVAGLGWVGGGVSGGDRQ